VEEGFPEVIERELTRAVAAEVLRFGMDGAPSQYLHVLRREVRTFQPDVIHNDFDESYCFLKTRYASSFLKIGFDAADQPFEIARVLPRDPAISNGPVARRVGQPQG
jgi:hypothetical protein